MHKKLVKKLVIYYLLSLILLCSSFAFVFFTNQHPELPLLVFIFFGCVVGMAILFLNIGIGHFVYHDSKSRGMNCVLWTLAAIFVPYLIGIIIYLVVRTPILIICPACGAVSPHMASFCAKCGHPLQSRCTQCHASLRDTDIFCPNCGARVNPVADHQ